MHNPSLINTERLLLKPLTACDDSFILELVNTPGWLKFIGNRNINNLSDAGAYIEKILNTESITYWVVSLKENQQKIGVVTFIKRDYLDHSDIGFAFLPNFCKNGYAHEATKAVLNKIIKDKKLPHILATTIPENINSIKLLKKIGLNFEKEIEAGKDTLHVYGASTENLIV